MNSSKSSRNKKFVKKAFCKMAECKVDKAAILHMWRQMIDQLGVEKYTSEQWQVQYEDFCRCMLSTSEPFVAIQSIEGLLRNAGIPLQAPFLPNAASASGIAKTSMSAGAKAKKPVPNKELLEQQRAQQQQIYQQVHQQQQEQLKNYDKKNVPILLQKCVSATRKLQPQGNPEQEATQNNVKMQGIQNYRIPRKIQDISQKPLPSNLVNALKGSKYSGKEENEKSYVPGAPEMDNMQGAMGGSTRPDVQPENKMQEKYEKGKENWFKKNSNEKTSAEVNHEVSDTSEFLNDSPSLSKSKESRKKKKNKSKKRDD